MTNDEKIKLQCEAKERYRMDWQSSMRTSFEKGKKEGLAEAANEIKRERNRANEAQKQAAAAQKFVTLTQKLLSANRFDDLDRALKDMSYREQQSLCFTTRDTNNAVKLRPQRTPSPRKSNLSYLSRYSLLVLLLIHPIFSSKPVFRSLPGR